MPQKNITLLADKDYTPPEPPEPPKPLTVAQKTKVKARITTILKSGPGVKRLVMKGDPPEPTPEDIPGGPMEHWKLIHYVCHQVRQIDGIKTVTAAQVRELIPEMKEAGAFAPGFDGTRNAEEVATPE
jgi:hypothetical protein